MKYWPSTNFFFSSFTPQNDCAHHLKEREKKLHAVWQRKMKNHLKIMTQSPKNNQRQRQKSNSMRNNSFAVHHESREARKKACTRFQYNSFFPCMSQWALRKLVFEYIILHIFIIHKVTSYSSANRMV